MAHVFADIGAAAAQVARDKVTSALVITTTTMPVWWAWMRAASDNAAVLVPFLLLGAAGLKFWNEWRVSRSRRAPKPDKKGAVNKAAAAALTAAARPSIKRYVIAAAAALAAVAVFLFAFRSEAKAAPAPAAPTTARRRRSSDHAGDDGAVPVEPDAPTDAPADYLLCRSLIGTREALPNGRPNPVVQKMGEATKGWGPKFDCRKVPWCMIGVNWFRVQVGKASTDSAMARSPTHSRLFQKIAEPFEGCLACLWRGAHNDGQTGHVGYYVKTVGAYVYVLGCNQSDGINIAKFHKSRVLGYYADRSAMAARTNRAAAATAAAGAGAGAATTVAAVTETTPDVPAQPPAVLEHIDTAKNVLTPIQDSVSAFPRMEKIAMVLGIVLALLTVAGAVYVMWRNSEDWRTRPPEPG